MVDLNGDGRITPDEFLSAAKEALEDETSAMRRSSTEVRDVLQRVSDYMRRNRWDM